MTRIIHNLNTIRSKEDAQRLSKLGYVFTEGDRIQDGTTYQTLPAAQGFLRERLGIIVMPECVSYNTWRFRIIREDWQNCRISEPEISEDSYVSHDYALLAGIRKVLESENH